MRSVPDHLEAPEPTGAMSAGQDAFLTWSRTTAPGFQLAPPQLVRPAVIALAPASTMSARPDVPPRTVATAFPAVRPAPGHPQADADKLDSVCTQLLRMFLPGQAVPARALRYAWVQTPLLHQGRRPEFHDKPVRAIRPIRARRFQKITGDFTDFHNDGPEHGSLPQRIKRIGQAFAPGPLLSSGRGRCPVLSSGRCLRLLGGGLDLLGSSRSEDEIARLLCLSTGDDQSLRIRLEKSQPVVDIRG